ncbi:hypothetical protein HAZT_HAZT007542 [Hyalella azteca]|nr:hypothetical protein HAZT_HAZT007542 [Hyalella azteca]
MLCAPGTYFNPQTSRCDFPENVDTSNCRVWTCEADGITYAGAECNEYYECEHGEPVQKFCADGLYYNADTGFCDFPSHVDTTTCNVSAFWDEKYD